MTDWLLTLFYFLIFLFIVRRNKYFLPAQIPFSFAAIAFAVKTAAGILLGYVYANHYKGDGDTFIFFKDGNTLHGILFSQPLDFFRILFGISPDNEYFREHYFRNFYFWYNNHFDFFFNDSRIIIRINSLIRFFSFGVYNVHVVFFSFLSFLGLTALYRFFSSAIRNNHKIFYAGVFLLPSVAFWGSGVMKEPVVILALGLLLYFSLKFKNRKTFYSLLLIIVFVFLLVLSKFYYAVALLPGLIAMLWCTNNKNIFLKFITTHIIWFLLLFCVRFMIPDYDVALIISFKQNNFVNMAEASNTGSLMSAEKLQPYWSDIIAKSPEAFYTSLVTPFEFSAIKILISLASIETLFILFLILLSAIFFRKPERSDYPLLLFAFSFVVITFTLLGLTTPVAGALVRYKVITLPFLMILILQFTDLSKTTRWFTSYKPK